ncbi:hsp70-like protein [Achlya hypogyna]|uniref:Hsp70-like protein n=1 Tax=Achlya hypogyna TaxID=1202772 RepID=A0A1V9YJC7_ACHHY|nr:hsp70-like protein [Achlya hypogyna]
MQLGSLVFALGAVVGLIGVFLARSGYTGKEHSVGIDLGTTYSVVAVNQKGHVSVIPDADGFTLLPSIVAFKDGGEVLVGRSARQYRSNDPKHTIFNAKRFIGRPFDDAVAAEAPHYEYGLSLDTHGVCFPLALSGHATNCVSPVAVGAHIVSHLKASAMAYLGHDQVYSAVIAVPASFDVAQRQATVAAFKAAGLKVANVLVEPTAAALAYGLDRKPDVHYVLVFDFGGGTLDVSLLYLQNGSFEVIDTAGDNHLGGEDLDDKLAANLVHRFEALLDGLPLPAVSALARTSDASAFPCTVSGMRGVAEKLKRDLSAAPEAVAACLVEATTASFAAGAEASLKMTRAEWERLMEPLLERTLAPIHEMLDGNGMAPTDVDEVVLVGGSSRIPWVHTQLQALFSREPNSHIDPDVAVAVGAARLAH